MEAPEDENKSERLRLSEAAQIRKTNGIESLRSSFFAFTLFTILLWILGLIFVWEFSITALLFLIPLTILLNWWSKQCNYCTLNNLMSEYFHGFYSIALQAFLMQIVTLLALTLIFGFKGALDTHDYNTRWVFYILCCSISYVIIEECCKLSFSIHIQNHFYHMNEICKTHTITSTSTWLGYATSSGLVWVFFAALAYREQKGHIPIILLLADGFIISIVGMPLHLLTSYFVGLSISKYCYNAIDYYDHCENVHEDKNMNHHHVLKRQPIAPSHQSSNVTSRTSSINGIDTNNNNNNEDVQLQQQQQQVDKQEQHSDHEEEHDHDDIHKRYMETKDHLQFLIVPVIARALYIFMLTLGVFVLEFRLVVYVTLFMEYGGLIWLIKKYESQLPIDYLQRTGRLNLFGIGLKGINNNNNSSDIARLGKQEETKTISENPNDNETEIEIQLENMEHQANAVR